jgi:2-oxoglutarate ferredoxin oxidoreductase subunit alpha
MALDLNILVGGEAGQGVQSVGIILAKTLVYGGLHIFADQDYESRIRGGHNFFRVRVKNSDVRTLSPAVDMLVALNPETIDLHAAELNTGGVIICDGEPANLKKESVKVLNIPLVALAEKTVKNKLMANTVAVGAVIGLLSYDFDMLAFILKTEFSPHGEKVVNDNVSAAWAGYSFARGECERIGCSAIQPKIGDESLLLVNGNEAISLGALAAGCKFLAGYPMTPASSILEYIVDKGRQYGAVSVHVEDEISAMNMAVGAGYTGVRSMIATSGGGFALMVEALALAGMTETPVVAVLAQRPGPATGLPTRTEQGELWFALHAGHGEFPRAILAPVDAEEAFYITVKAFNLAEKFQTPVIILTDHHLATSYATVRGFDLDRVKIDRGQLLSNAQVNEMTDYRRHLITSSGISPRALPGQGKALVVTDSDEHDEAGHMIEDAATRRLQVEKRMRKLNGLRGEITAPEFHTASGAVATLIGWGSPCPAIEEAAALLKKDDRPVNTLCFSEIWPFPAEAAAKALDKGGKNIIIEGNATAQLAGLIRRETGIKVDASVLKYDGRPFSPAGIVRRLREEVGL